MQLNLTCLKYYSKKRCVVYLGVARPIAYMEATGGGRIGRNRLCLLGSFLGSNPLSCLIFRFESGDSANAVPN